MSDNDMLYMDVTTTCTDCVLQGKTSEGCAFCDGRGRAYLHDMYKRENDALREKVEAHIWLREVEGYELEYEHPYCRAVGISYALTKDKTTPRAKRKKAYENAQESYEAIKSAALKAVGE